MPDATILTSEQIDSAFRANDERLRDGLARVAIRMKTEPPAEMTQAELAASRDRLREGLARRRLKLVEM